MIKALFFDLDNTLLDRDSSVERFIAFQYERLIPGKIRKKDYCKRFIELDAGGYVWKDRVYQQLVEEFDIGFLSWETLLADYVENFHTSCVPYCNLHSCLSSLAAYSLGIISNGYGAFQLRNIQALGIEKYFKVILLSEWEGVKKPDPEIFCKGLQKVKVLPEESIFIGDHIENDINPARQAGMKTIWKRNGRNGDGSADYAIDALDEIPNLVETLSGKLKFCR
ncbi:HAD family hydrolase [Bacillus sp. FJAT-42376]|uniref:HAD family hydrolase n=1 Tax=Bacillus sp. FJAT-42376 TaxID=2014076 RepID=UPI000F4F5964|nr:HAD family hydrolase [Bacillus sp. FJAT-42376]AZB43399.1 HAD family hydrolase [Bacillus sp. FJAT-42376]